MTSACWQKQQCRRWRTVPHPSRCTPPYGLVRSPCQRTHARPSLGSPRPRLSRPNCTPAYSRGTDRLREHGSEIGKWYRAAAVAARGST